MKEFPWLVGIAGILAVVGIIGTAIRLLGL